MLLLLLSAGISLTATAVSWVNGHRTDKVQKQIQSLEVKRQRLYQEDVAQRVQMLIPYLKQLTEIVSDELAVRYAVEADLYGCMQKAIALRKKRFGSLESDAVRRLTLELELCLSQVQAERVYLQTLQQSIQSFDSARSEIPAPAALELPADFPRDGAYLQFDSEVPDRLHGYRLDVVDSTESNKAGGLLFQVDHQRKTAKLSSSLRLLHEANISGGRIPLRAKVVRRDSEGVHLEASGIALLLLGTSRNKEFFPENEVEIYAANWTMSELSRASLQRPLRVRAYPPADGSGNRWSCIPVAIKNEQFESLAHAVNALDPLAKDEPPWRVYMLPAGELVFSMGTVSLIAEPSIASKSFKLSEVRMRAEVPAVSVRVHAKLWFFVPGSEDEEEVERTQFLPFLNAVNDELQTSHTRRNEQHTALRLRKMSMIYQDQENYFRETRSIGVITFAHDKASRSVSVVVLESHLPEWLVAAVQAPAVHRLRACGRHTVWNIKSAEWANERLSLLRLEILVPNTTLMQDADLQGICRLELAYEGMQQQTLSQALERTITGRFVSAGVHATLLGLSGKAVPNKHYGSDAVDRLLRRDTDVLAIWGPPGTGKTTTLIKWLLWLFQPEKSGSWPTILLTAPTHVAVNKLLTDLLEKAPWLADESVRYCSPDRIADTGLETVWHQELMSVLDRARRGVGRDMQTDRWENLLEIREGREAAARWLLGARHIHVVTCTGMARRDYGLLGRNFDIAIVDEAGKAFGAELMIPCSAAQRVLLVGDHNQLPPTVTSDSLDPKIGYRLPLEEVRELLERNTFQDTFEQLPAEKKAMLTKQYRMHVHIGSVVSQLFYDGKLESHRTGGEWSLTQKRLTFLDFSKVRTYRHKRAKFSDSQENPTERAVLRALLQELSQNNPGTIQTLLIVCPYKAQRLAVQQEMRKKRYSFKIEAATVDAVQGGQADMVILLMTRSSGSVQFLLDRHRLNVALSRAREAVIILGHGRCLTRTQGGPFERLLEIGAREKTLQHMFVAPEEDNWEVLAQKVSLR